jgi:2-iminobutanoate/2-iminopropanoate deaminase
MKKIIYTTGAPAPIGPYSQAVQVDNVLYVSGQIPVDPESGELITGNIELESELVMKNLHAILSEAGGGFENVVKCSIFLRKMEDFQKVNAIYGHFFYQRSACQGNR